MYVYGSYESRLIQGLQKDICMYIYPQDLEAVI